MFQKMWVFIITVVRIWGLTKVKCTLVQALRLCTGRTAHRGSRGSSAINNVLSLYRVLSGVYSAHWAVIMTSRDSKMSKRGTAGKRKHVTLAARCKVAEAELWLWLTRHWIVTCFWYGETDVPAMIVYVASSDSVKGHFIREILKRPKLAEVDRVWCRYCTLTL